MNWRWTAHRLLISVFLVVHLGATIIWVLPPCPIKQRGLPAAWYYIRPLGLWQCWAMFAPDPLRESPKLEAEVVDAKGMRYAYSYPHMADFSWWRGIPRFRHAKYAVSLSVDEFEKPREFAARHVLRKLSLSDEVFPVSVHLYYRIEDPPPPGQLADPMKPTRVRTLATFDFTRPNEVRR